MLRTFGTAAAWFAAPQLGGFVIAGVTGQWGWVALGSLVGVAGLVASLCTAEAPMPTGDVLSLLGEPRQRDGR